MNERKKRLHVYILDVFL